MNFSTGTGPPTILTALSRPTDVTVSIHRSEVQCINASTIMSETSIQSFASIMSAALNSRADSSSQSAMTLPDLSLGSLVSGISTPGRNHRVPSVSSQTTALSSAPISTPSPPDHHAPVSLRKRTDEPGSALKRLVMSGHDDGDDAGEGGDFLDTPGHKWDGPDTPVANRKRARATPGGNKGVTLTLRDQEKVILISLLFFCVVTGLHATTTLRHTLAHR